MSERPEGNGAREALVEILGEAAEERNHVSGVTWVDWLLLRLAEAGYVIKPLVEH